MTRPRDRGHQPDEGTTGPNVDLLAADIVCKYIVALNLVTMQQ